MAEFLNSFTGLTPDRKLTARELSRAIRVALSAEEEAIHLYEALADAGDNTLAREVLQSVAEEERVDVGEFQRLLNLLLDDEATRLAESARSVKGAETRLFQVPELAPDAALEASGAKSARKAFAHIPIARPGHLAEADALIFGTPTRFGNMCAQMRNFLDQTGELWMKGGLIGKIGSVLASTGTQQGGQETTITSFYNTLIHLGMIVVGVPYSEKACSIWRK